MQDRRRYLSLRKTEVSTRQKEFWLFYMFNLWELQVVIQESRAVSRKEPPRDAGLVSLYNTNSFKYDRPTELQQLVISAKRPLMLSG